ncbi:hypothetical protein SAMN05216391_1424 [Lachnospiraceae bacterium KHCPX20]|nr:hypothetical protein SAMN05216391_1424 [Lachnospiraceae bacterium KHCPX20]
MANFKKGIALALAATTALSFAPVSTLGIPSAIVAEAAAITGTYTAVKGGVTTNIVADDGVTYELINPNAEVEDTATHAVLPTAALGWGIYDASTGKIVDIPSDVGTVTATKGSLKLYVKDASAMKTAINGKAIVGFKTTGAFSARTDIEDNAQDVVYTGTIAFTDANKGSTKAIEVNATVNATAGVAGTISSDFLDGVELTAGSNNKIVHYTDTDFAGAVPTVTDQTGNKVTFADAATAPGANDNILKGIKVSTAAGLAKGTYYETAYVPYTVGSGNYIAKINLTVNVGTGATIAVKDGNTVYGSTNPAEVSADPVIYLNLGDNKTFDISKHIVSDVAGLKYEYSRDTTNVSIDANGVMTANSVGDALVTVKGSANGQTSTLTLQVRVSQNGADTLIVTDGKDQTADAFTVNDYTNNKAGVLADGANNEANLAKAAVKYIQCTVTGNETQNIKFKPVVKSTNNATLRYSFVNDNSAKGVTIDPTTGEITIDYKHVDGKTAVTGTDALGTYAVQVVASPTAKSELTKSYFMLVIDYPDKAIVDVEDAYKVGTWDDNTANQVAIDDWSMNAAAAQDYEVLDNKADALVNSSLYKDEDVKNFATTLTTTAARGATVSHAKAGAEGKTLHVIASNAQDPTAKTGYTAKITTLTAVKGVANYVDTITDVSTGKNIFTNNANGKAHATEFAIEKNAQLKVALKNPVAATSSIELQVANAADNHIVNQPQFVTAVVDNDNTTVDLYRNAEGTQVIGLVPAGHISKTDRSIVRNETTNLAVTYRADKAEEEIAKPAKVTSVKIANVKGAKAKVSFKSVKGALGYKVVYTVGKKTVTKTLKGAAKTSVTLSVAKGKKVTVKVRAYNKSVKGKTQFGAYSAKKSLKTDKK